MLSDKGTNIFSEIGKIFKEKKMTIFVVNKGNERLCLARLTE